MVWNAVLEDLLQLDFVGEIQELLTAQAESEKTSLSSKGKVSSVWEIGVTGKRLARRAISVMTVALCAEGFLGVLLHAALGYSSDT